MVKHIFLRQAIEQIKAVDNNGKAVPFDLECRTFNSNNKMGGALKKYRRARLLVGEKLKGKAFIEAEHFYRRDKSRKNPNHWDNATINIETEGARIVKVKLRYITKFNGIPVVY